MPWSIIQTSGIIKVKHKVSGINSPDNIKDVISDFFVRIVEINQQWNLLLELITCYRPVMAEAKQYTYYLLLILNIN
ncbi:MAG: hypothetical protein EGP11_04225 [SAR202 cluster bacterium]|nr:MAG: hypothetical protein EGP11_04225 [SAR202 cluster bacterium]GIT18869.1 MAG: hypothetical protein CM1200mP39_16750 [Dehalococcoidia bacterium]